MDEGRVRFYADSSLNNGLIVIKGKRAKDKQWLESRKCYHILKRSIKVGQCKGTSSSKVSRNLWHVHDKRGGSIEDPEQG